MDSLYWTSLNPKVKLKQTKKLFWNKYAYKVKLLVPGGNFMCSYLSNIYKNSDPAEYVRKRLQNNSSDISINVYSSPQLTQRLTERQAKLKLYNANPTVLKILKEQKLETDVQFRVEEPFISLYYNNEEQLKNIVNKLPKQYIKDVLLEVNGITDSEHQERLKPNVILDTQVGYKYKVQLQLTQTVRQNGPQIVRYLDSLGKNSAKYPDSFRLELQHRGHSWHTQTYFYCNEKDILDFINLICPGACTLNQVYKLEPKKHK